MADLLSPRDLMDAAVQRAMVEHAKELDRALGESLAIYGNAAIILELHQPPRVARPDELQDLIRRGLL